MQHKVFLCEFEVQTAVMSIRTVSWGVMPHVVLCKQCPAYHIICMLQCLELVWPVSSWKYVFLFVICFVLNVIV